MLKRKRFLIGGVIIFLAIGFLAYTGFMGGATYYYEVNELLAQGSSIYGENVRVNGKVVPDSVEQEAQGTILRFTIVDIEGEESLPVTYQGVVPDTFKAGNEVIAEGQYGADGIFKANNILPKCASRYVAEAGSANGN